MKSYYLSVLRVGVYKKLLFLGELICQVSVLTLGINKKLPLAFVGKICQEKIFSHDALETGG